MHISHKRPFKTPQIFLVIYFILFFALTYIHSDSIYYFFNFNPIINGDTKNIDYQTWNKYSWFLYQADKPVEALEANQKAQIAAEDYFKTVKDPETIKDLDDIKIHAQEIKDRNWTTGP